MKIFITENSPVIRERLTEMLKSIPNVELAGEADDAAKVVRGLNAIQPDVVILGFSSARDNLEVLRRIRLLPLSVTVIVMTNRVHSLYRNKCMDTGADYFLDKSRDIGVLNDLLYGLAEEFAPGAGQVASR